MSELNTRESGDPAPLPVTVMVDVADTGPNDPESVPVIVALPAETPVASPVELIVATAVLEDNHVTSSVTFLDVLA